MGNGMGWHRPIAVPGRMTARGRAGHGSSTLLTVALQSRTSAFRLKPTLAQQRLLSAVADS